MHTDVHAAGSFVCECVPVCVCLRMCLYSARGSRALSYSCVCVCVIGDWDKTRLDGSLQDQERHHGLARAKAAPLNSLAYELAVALAGPLICLRVFNSLVLELENLPSSVFDNSGRSHTHTHHTHTHTQTHKHTHAVVAEYGAGLSGVAVVWNEVVMELRWHWEHLAALPRMLPTEVPVHRHALLYQKVGCVSPGVEDSKCFTTLLHDRMQEYWCRCACHARSC